jgi:hypothetical protein
MISLESLFRGWIDHVHVATAEAAAGQATP